jgi:hypothetical protein
VRYGLLWPRSDGSGDIEEIGIDFTPLPGSGSLPVQLEEAIGFTPDVVYFHIEGGGPADHFGSPEHSRFSKCPNRTLAPSSPRLHQAREFNLHSKRASF